MELFSPSPKNMLSVIDVGRDLIFLPKNFPIEIPRLLHGDLQDKIDPYLKPIYDALEDMIPVQKMKKFIENKTIEIAPLAYMRGRTLKNAFILLDEPKVKRDSLDNDCP